MGLQQADAAKSNARSRRPRWRRPGAVAQATAMLDRPQEPAQRDHREPHGRPRAVARRRGGRRGQLHPGDGLAGDAAHDAGRRQRRLRAAARWTRRTSARCTSASRRASWSSRSRTRSFEGKVTKISPLGEEKDNVTTFEVRVSIQNPTRRAEGQHERQRRDHPRGEEERPAGPGVGGCSTTRTARPRWRCPTRRRPRRARKKFAVQLGISNGVKTEIEVAGLKEGDKVVLQ